MTENRFDRAAGNWDQEKRRIELADAIAAGIARLPLHTGMQAMEYGCGTGLVGLKLAPSLGSLVAADSSAGMLEILRNKISEQGITNVSPHLLDLHQDDFNREFDLIFSAMTLHHLENVQAVLAKLCDCLKPGSILALADLDEEDGSFHKDNPDGVMHHGFNRQKLARDLEMLGLLAIETSTVHTIRRPGSHGSERSFPVFLMTAEKKS